MSQSFEFKDPFANFDYFSDQNDPEINFRDELNDDGDVIFVGDYVELNRY